MNYPTPRCTLKSGDSQFTSPTECFYLCYRGSIAHNMFVPSIDPNSIDDIDLMGFTVGGPEHYFGLHEWGSRGTQEIKQGCYDVVLYELRKAVALLLQGNPNILSMLWVKPEHILVHDNAATQLRAARQLFVGKHVYNAFAGYAHQQLEKMESRDPSELREYLAVTAELKYRGSHPNCKGIKGDDPLQAWAQASGEARNVREWGAEKLLQKLAHYHRKGENLGYLGDKRKQLVLQHGYDSKNAAHLIRLLRMCVEFMQTGELLVKRPDAQELLTIKRGEWKLEDVKKLATHLFAEAKSARDKSSLPEAPATEAVEKLLIDILEQKLTGKVAVH